VCRFLCSHCVAFGGALLCVADFGALCRNVCVSRFLQCWWKQKSLQPLQFASMSLAMMRSIEIRNIGGNLTVQASMMSLVAIAVTMLCLQTGVLWCLLRDRLRDGPAAGTPPVRHVSAQQTPREPDVPVLNMDAVDTNTLLRSHPCVLTSKTSKSMFHVNPKCDYVRQMVPPARELLLCSRCNVP
jgi:hypothetical protein